MYAESHVNPEPVGHGLMIERIFNAPRERVFAMWTQPELMARWWGPRGFTSPVLKIDLRPGGQFLGCMRSPEGQDFWSKGEYREIVVPERLVSTDSFADADGNLVLPTQYGMSAEWPAEALITTTFTEQAGKTKLTIHHDFGAVPEAEREMCRQGWNESLDKLEEELAK